MKLFLTVVYLVVLTAANLLGFDKVDALLSKALNSPNDLMAFAEANRALKESQDPRVAEAFKKLLTVTTTKEIRQGSALFLITHGDQRPEVFEILARYAREAVETTAPISAKSDQSPQKDAISPQFKNWCSANQLKLEDCYALVTRYPTDIWIVASTKDKRAIPILRRGLANPWEMIVYVSIRGLALLNDTDALLWIEGALMRMPRQFQPMGAEALEEFDDPRVSALIERFIPDKKRRDELESRRKLRPQRAQ